MKVINPGILSWRKLIPPAPQGHSSTTAQGLLCTGGVTAPLCSHHCSSTGAGTSLQAKPRSYPFSRQGKVQGFERYQIHKPREAQELPELCPSHNEPREHRRGSGNAPSALASSQQQDRLLTKSPWDTILGLDFRWQLHSKSMDLLENCILYFSRWVWLDFGFGVGCLGVFLVLSGLGLLGVFYNLYTDCFDGSLQFQTGYACATFKKSCNDWHCKLC